MAKIDITKSELVWSGKYSEDGSIREVPHIHLPFQVIERVNESRATRESKKNTPASLFDFYAGKEGDTFADGWRNKLIWGDNLLVMGSLLEKFSGKVNLVYIDPPFATGIDFSFTAEIGESGEHLTKEHSLMEEKAYRDTWGASPESYYGMIYDRLRLIRELLTPNGILMLHLGRNLISHGAKLICDEIFGTSQYINDITWKRSHAHGDAGQGANHFGRVTESIFIYAKQTPYTWNPQYLPYTQEILARDYKYVDDKTGKRYRLMPVDGPGGAAKGNPFYEFLGVKGYWRYSKETMARLHQEGEIVLSSTGKSLSRKKFLEDARGTPVTDLWDDVNRISPTSNERLDYPTQKPEALLERAINTASNPGDLVADFFSGSGTTLAVAERLGRRWIGCDLGRWSIHTTRKRLLGIENCKPFELLNLGKYERQYWQGVTLGGEKDQQTLLYEYLAFVLKLYNGQPISGLAHLHGKKGRAMIHIGAIDSPVTIDEVGLAIEECIRVKQPELHVLGWEWEMGLAGPNNGVKKGSPMHEVAKQRGIKLLLLQIPREMMEQQAVDEGEITFFELAYLNVEIMHPKKLHVAVKLKDFVIPNTELIPEEVRDKVKKWSDYIDYWAVDWDFQNDSFMQGWVTYRTRNERTLVLESDTYKYEKSGTYRVLVKVVDIFGNDTSQAYTVDVK